MRTYTQNGDDSLRYKNKRIVIWKDKKNMDRAKGMSAGVKKNIW